MRTSSRGESRRKRWSACAAVVALLCALPPRALAHGGAYNPAPTIPTGPFGPGVPGPSTGMPGGAAPGNATNAVGNRASWEDWWHFNKDPYLELKRAVASGLPYTSADELLSGQGHGAGVSPDVLRSRVAPALRALLEAEKSPEIVGATLVALARVCGPTGAAMQGPASNRGVANADAATIALMQSRLHDPNQEIAETAALSLGILRSEDSLPILEALLTESALGKELVGGRAVSDRTKAFAAYGIGLVGTSAKNNRARQMVARVLCGFLTRNESSTARVAPVVDVDVAAVIALSIDRLDPERSPIPAVASPGLALGPAQGPAWVSRQSELRFVRGIFAEPRHPAVVRAHVATAIARLASEAPEDIRAEGEQELLEALRSRSRIENQTLQSCVQGLGLLADSGSSAVDRKIRMALLQTMEDGDVQARCFALIALAEIGGRAAAAEDEGDGPAVYRNILTGQVLRGHGSTRPWAAIALGVLERKLADARAAAAKSGGKQASVGPDGGQTSGAEAAAIERSREILRGYFAAAKQRTHFGAGAIALGLCRDRKAVPMLLERLGDTSEDQGQGYIALALGMIGEMQAASSLKDVVRASKYKPESLEQASIALALLGDKSAAPELADMLAKAQGQSAQASIATALGRIGDVRTIEPLLKLIDRKDLTASARAFAAAALGQVADNDPLPWYTPIAVDLNYAATTGTLLAGDGSGLLEIL